VLLLWLLSQRRNREHLHDQFAVGVGCQISIGNDLVLVDQTYKKGQADVRVVVKQKYKTNE
jgi:hypothetical protein